MTIRQATLTDAGVLARLGLLMWPHHALEELAEEFASLLPCGGCACFLMEESGAPVGFAQCQLRHDYVEGTDSSPVGYLEAVFVAEGYRRQGRATALVHACEAWARAQGCTEFASDCELTNTDSLAFHLSAGFTEANRIICFTKAL